jgi:hypothetical protein
MFDGHPQTVAEPNLERLERIAIRQFEDLGRVHTSMSMSLYQRPAASVTGSIASGASIVADCSVSRFENRSTSLSNR